MHKLMEYICDELEELDRKAGKEGKLSMAEVEYADKLAHIKKSILTSDELWDDSEYNMAGGESGQPRTSYRRGGSSRREGMEGKREGGSPMEGNSYTRGRGRNARRDSMGRYTNNGSSYAESEEMVEELRELMQDAPDQQIKMEFERLIQKLEQM